MEESALIIRGDVGIVLYDALGEVKDERSIHNLVTTAGRGFIFDRMLGTSAGVMSHMEVGTGTTNPAAGDTALESAVSGSRTALASSTDNGTSVTYVCNFGAGTGTGALTEAGILNASSGGTLLCRTEFSVVNKAADDTMSITWTISITAS